VRDRVKAWYHFWCFRWTGRVSGGHWDPGSNSSSYGWEKWQWEYCENRHHGC